MAWGCRALWAFMLCIASARASNFKLSGHIKDENGAPVAGAHITVGSTPPLTPGSWQAETDPEGAFTVALPGPGDYLIGVEREGFYQLKDQPVQAGGEAEGQEITLVINRVREVFQAVDVNAQPSPVDIDQTHNEERLTGTEINDILYPNSHSLVNSMTMMPGVVQDPGGAIALQRLDRRSDRVPAERIQCDESDFRPIQYDAGGGRNSIRGLLFRTILARVWQGLGRRAGDQHRERHGRVPLHGHRFCSRGGCKQGVRLGNWYPRFGLSGPIVRGRAWFSDTLFTQYTETLITGLPSGQDTSTGWAGSNLLHAQVNLTPRNIVYADFLVNLGNAGRVGLGALDPVSTTQTVRTHEYFGSVKDQVYLGSRSMLEFGYAHNDFFTSQTPQGDNLYVFSPAGRSGNYFVTATQQASRDQALVHGYAPQFHFWGSHQIQAGLDADVLHYNGDSSRTGYELVGLSGQILSETTFTGSGVFRVRDTEAAPWVLDTWRIAKRFQIDAGIRQDWDRRVDRAGWSPRASFSWAPFASGLTRVSGGYAVTHDAVALAPFGMVLDQTALTTTYNSSGVPAGPPASSTFMLGPGPLELPRATNWSLDVDRQISAHLFASVKYLRRRGTDGFDFVNTLAPDAPPSVLPLPNAAAGGVYELENLRRDDYDSVQIAAHQTFSGQYEWMLSYTRSQALSNAVLERQFGRAAAGSSQSGSHAVGCAAIACWAGRTYRCRAEEKKVGHRCAGRCAFRLSRFRCSNRPGSISGAVDSHRYPFNFDLNVAIERMITLHNYRFALRAGADNLTNSKNPTAVENVIGASQYLQFLGDEGRHFVVRIRFFGRAGTK